MTALVRCLLVAAAVTGLLSVGGLPTAPAQKEKGKADKMEKVGTIEINKDKAGDYRFKVLDPDGKTIAMCVKGYEKKEDCLKALDMVKSTLATAKVTEGKGGKDDDKEMKDDKKKADPKKTADPKKGGN